MIECDYIKRGDCMELMRELPDECIDLCATDPPYLLTSRGAIGTMSGFMTREKAMKGKVFDNNSTPIRQWLPEVVRVLKDGAHCYVMCNQINLLEYLQAIKENGLKFLRALIWDKVSPICGVGYMSRYEFILFCYKGRFVPVNDCGVADILRIPNTKPKDKDGNNLHDTPKPIGLMQTLISQSSRQGEIVLDPFMGIGSTALAAIREKRHYIGYELQQEYYDTALRRIENEKSQPTLF